MAKSFMPPAGTFEIAPFAVPVGVSITNVWARDNRGAWRMAECNVALEEGETLWWRYGDTLCVYRDGESVMIKIDSPPWGRWDEVVGLVFDQPHTHDDPDTMIGFGFSVGGALDLVVEGGR